MSAAGAADTTAPAQDPMAVMRSRGFVGLLAIAALVGVLSSVAAWLFLEAIHLIQGLAYEDLPDALGFGATPSWWSLPLLFVAGLVTAVAISRFPGEGGHVPAHGLDPAPSPPGVLPGVLLAALAGIGLGVVLGPEGPLLALGGGLGLFVVRLLRRDPHSQLALVVATSGTFAALSFLFGSPLIAAVLLIEAAGLGGAMLPLVLVPGLIAAAIGSLISVGLGSWTGVDTAAISIDPLSLPDFARPDLADFLWAIPLSAAIAIGVVGVLRIGRGVVPVAKRRPLLALPAIGLATGLLALGFAEATGYGADHVLFSGQEALGGLVNSAAGWSVGALALLLACKGIAYGLALGSFRGGPVFPAIFLGAAAGILASQLPGLDPTPAVAVGLGAATAAVLRLPLSAVVLATLLTSSAGLGAGPVVIVGVATAYLVTLAIDPRSPAGDATAAAA